MVSLEREQQVQEAQYSYPYHYIPTWEAQHFSQVQYWSWGFRYLGGMKVVLDAVDKASFTSLIDIGCGDGRFLGEVARRYPNKDLLGVDYSQHAISLAKVMNSHLAYRCVNIIDSPPTTQFDIATMVEVLEHIPLEFVDAFLNSTAQSLIENGCLILTVPHLNKRVSDKHYQHFDSKKLRELLTPYFEELQFIPFDPLSKTMLLLQKLLGGKGSHFVLTNQTVLSWFFQLYQEKYLYAANEKVCTRIAVICRKK